MRSLKALSRRCNARRAPRRKTWRPLITRVAGKFNRQSADRSADRSLIIDAGAMLALDAGAADGAMLALPDAGAAEGAMLALPDAGAADGAMLTLLDAADADGMELHHLPRSASAEEKALLVDGMLSLWNAHRARGVVPLPAAEAVMREELEHPDVEFFYFQASSQIIAAAAYYLNTDYLQSGCTVVWLQACAVHRQT